MWFENHVHTVTHKAACNRDEPIFASYQSTPVQTDARSHAFIRPRRCTATRTDARSELAEVAALSTSKQRVASATR